MGEKEEQKEKIENATTVSTMREGKDEKEKRREEKSVCKEKFFRDTMRLITIGLVSSLCFSFIPLGPRIKVGNFQFNAGER